MPITPVKIANKFLDRAASIGYERGEIVSLSMEVLRLNEAYTQAVKAIKSIPFLSEDPGVKKCYEWMINYGPKK